MDGFCVVIGSYEYDLFIEYLPEENQMTCTRKLRMFGDKNEIPRSHCKQTDPDMLFSGYEPYIFGLTHTQMEGDWGRF